ncbi:gluconokinase [Lactiplantibacillus daowaiensis]|uniref:Gluconokinase n=1 Tax=Lactiplantibacillus daowaiensis TaxID=2559918 RepID=A0ABW1RWC1_9LACO|nr:gluconokinase [Lactiplantibacillus daowaiensis]
MQAMLGVDIGTTSTKVVLYDQNGQVIASANHGYPLYQTTPGMAEEAPAEIYQAMVQGLTEVTAKQPQLPIGGISFSAAMHSLILLAADGQPLTRMYTWADNRAKAAADQLRTRSDALTLYQHTGTPLHPMTPLAKLVWLEQTQPALKHAARWVVDIKSYLIYRLTGQLVMDYSIANATGLFNMQTFDWDPLALQLAAIKADQLPALVDTTAQVTGLAADLAAQWHLTPTTPLIVGASDGCLSNLGLNALQPGVAALTIGTSGAVRVVSDHPQLDANGRLFCYYLAPNRWVIGGPVNNGGNVLAWVRQQLFGHDAAVPSLAKLSDLVSQVPAGSHGLLMQPYLNGERAPLWNADARGAFFGLTAQTTRAEMTRAALEGITFNLVHVAKLVQNLTGPFTSLQATGGFANSAPWQQLIADSFATPVTIPNSFESSCLGAAILGWVSLGELANIEAASTLVGAEQTIVPDPATVATYQQLYLLYQQLQQVSQPLCQQLARFK